MHPSVHAAWKSFSEPFEGRVLSMYLDIRGLVSTGVGNLIDTVGEAQKLPWRHQSTGMPATPYEIGEAWHRLKGAPEYAHKSTAAARALTGLVLTEADVDALVERKLRESDAYITEHWFPRFQEIPADAQLAILSMAWAVGPAFNTKFPLFTAAALAGKWWDCMAGCKIREEGNPGVVPRNKANKLCFENATHVATNRDDPRVLHWPNRYQPGLVMPEDNPRLDPPGTIAEAVAAAASSRLDLLEDRSDAREQMREADPDEITVNDPPKGNA